MIIKGGGDSGDDGDNGCCGDHCRSNSVGFITVVVLHVAVVPVVFVNWLSRRWCEVMRRGRI